jgi:hypothetical protein
MNKKPRLAIPKGSLFNSFQKYSNLCGYDMNIYPMFEKKDNNTLRLIGLVLLGITICIYAVLVAKFLFIN